MAASRTGSGAVVETARPASEADARERFAAYLRDRNQPATPQRLAVADILLAADAPIAAEDVVAELARRGTSAGVATVYRTIDLLLACGLISERDEGEGFRRFVPVREPTAQDQLLCTSCGAVVEFSDSRLTPIVDAAARAERFDAKRHRLVVYGLCSSCRQAPGASHQSPVE